MPFEAPEGEAATWLRAKKKGSSTGQEKKGAIEKEGEHEPEPERERERGQERSTGGDGRKRRESEPKSLTRLTASEELELNFPSWSRKTEQGWGAETIETDIFNKNASSSIEVPEFWKGAAGLSMDGIVEGVTHWPVDGVLQPMIFIVIASFRDYMCRTTITTMLDRARYPERLR